MPYSYVFNDVVVSSDELSEKISLGALATYEQELRSDPTATLEFSNQIADWFGGNIQAAANENIQANAATYVSIIQRTLERAVRNIDLSVNLADLIAGL
jgi:hypothetical protein